jgi:nitrogen PTS system EIIA component
MKIPDFLSPTDVMVDLRVPEKRQLLQELARKAALALAIPAEAIALALLAREDLGSTGTGGGIAVPHARIEGVTKPFGMLVKLKQPIDFEAVDGRPVDLVFILLLPASPDAAQLGALASVARKLRAPPDLVRMRHAKTPAELYSAIIA